MSLSCSTVSVRRLLCRGKMAKVTFFALVLYPGLPLAASCASNAPERHGCFPIDVVLAPRSFAQIEPTIVERVAVNVIDFERPFAGHPKPSEPMGAISLIANTDHDLPLFPRSGWFADSILAAPLAWRSTLPPSEDTRFGVVIEYLADVECGQVVALWSHDQRYTTASRV